MTGEIDAYIKFLPQILRKKVKADRYAIVFRGVFGQTMGRNDFYESEALRTRANQAIQQAVVRDLGANVLAHQGSSSLFLDFTFGLNRNSFHFEQDLSQFLSNLNSSEKIEEALYSVPIYGSQVNLVDVRDMVFQTLKNEGILDSQNRFRFVKDVQAKSLAKIFSK